MMLKFLERFEVLYKKKEIEVKEKKRREKKKEREKLKVPELEQERYELHKQGDGSPEENYKLKVKSMISIQRSSS